MAKRCPVQVANEAADIAEANERRAIALRNKEIADVQRRLAWPLVLKSLLSVASVLAAAGWLLQLILKLRANG